MSAGTPKVLLTIDRDHAIWTAARNDPRAAYLPFACREIVAGNVSDAVVTVTDWAKLQAFVSDLPGGRLALPLAVADAPPPPAPEATDRAIAARKIAELITALGATSPSGGDVMREESGRYYAVNFGFGYLISGAVYLYSLGYIRVSYVAETVAVPPNGLPRIDNRVFSSIDLAAKFLTLAIHERKYADALAIPLREKKAKKG